MALLAVDLAGDRPPDSFRLFQSGWNETEQGRFLFDGVAAAMVMEAAEAHGVDKMVDLEHLSLDRKALNFDPDARAWFNLELRDNGELWAVNVKWTDDGAARLAEKRQRYISPAFRFDDDGRITKLLNVAITALPASHGTKELVAARCGGEHTAALAATRGNRMDKATILAALEAIAKGDAKKMAAILRELIAQAAAGDPAPAAEPAPEPAPPPPEEEGAAAAAGEDEEPPPAAMSAAPAASSASSADDSAAELAMAALLEATGADSPSAALSSIGAWKESHIARAADREKLEADRKALERSERLTLVGRLVELRCEDPGTAWEDCTAERPSKPVARLANEPIEDLRARVARLSSSRSSKDSPPQAPAGDGVGVKTFKIRGQVVTLSALEQEHCKNNGADLEKYAAIKLSQGRISACDPSEV